MQGQRAERVGLPIHSVHFHLTGETPTPSQNPFRTHPPKELAATLLWCGGEVLTPWADTTEWRGDSSCTAPTAESGNSGQELSLLMVLCLLLRVLAEAFVQFTHILLLLTLCPMKNALTTLCQT